MIHQFFDQVTPQFFALYFTDESGGANLLTSINGDFTTDPIEINKPFFTERDFTVGCVPAGNLSCTLQNADGRFSGFPFGEARSFIGYQSGYGPEETFSIQGHEIEFGPGGILVDGDDIANSRNALSCVIVDVYGAYLYYIDDNGKAAKAEVADITNVTVLGDPTPFFEQTLADHPGRITYFKYGYEIGDATLLEIWEDGTATDYAPIPTGVFIVERPRSTSTLTIDITNAYDRTRAFDISCGTFIATEKAKYPTLTCTAADFIGDIMDVFGYVVYVSTVSQNTNIRLDWIENRAYTYRELLSMALEACCACTWADITGEYDIEHLGIGSVLDTYLAGNIVANGYDRADYYVQQVQGVELYKANNTVWVSGTTVPGDNNYVIQNNPLVDEDTLQDSNFVSNVTHYSDGYSPYGKYHPVTVSLTEMDPTILRHGMLTAAIENIYTGVVEEVPIWELNIYWCGKTYGEIISGGEEYRYRS